MGHVRAAGHPADRSVEADLLAGGVLELYALGLVSAEMKREVEEIHTSRDLHLGELRQLDHHVLVVDGVETAGVGHEVHRMAADVGDREHAGCGAGVHLDGRDAEAQRRSA